MQQLTRENCVGHAFPSAVTPPAPTDHPVRVLQFGEGNFLRGFVDWMIDRMNREGLFNGRVRVVQPIERGLVDLLNRQDGLYSLYLRGLEKGEIVEQKEIIASIAGGINPYAEFDAFLTEADNPDLRFIVSNTTEAGIAYSGSDRFEDAPPASFPGKVVRLLHRRWKSFGGARDKGFIFLPCELIDRNGHALKATVLRLTEEWGLEDGFRGWVEAANIFCNTLVDRIVTGYPFEKIDAYAEELGLADSLIDTGEIFHLWVIEGPASIREEFPLHEAGIRVVWTDDMTPYRTRKVRILNGAHTMTVLAAYLAGLDTVKACLDDETVTAYMRRGLFEEIIPTMQMPAEELEEFAEQVLERFANPFISHYLLSISLNSVSKFKARVLPTLKDSLAAAGRVPEVLSFSLAALISFYRGTAIHNGALIGTRNGQTYKICDSPEVLEFFHAAWSRYDGSEESAAGLVRDLLGAEPLWGEDLNLLPGLTERVAAHLASIRGLGMRTALKSLTAVGVAS